MGNAARIVLHWLSIIVWVYLFSKNAHTYYLIGRYEKKGYRYLFVAILGFIYMLFLICIFLVHMV